jgi:hypothetical protein
MFQRPAVILVVLLSLTTLKIDPALPALAPEYPPFAMVCSENHYFAIGYWENIDERVLQSGGFNESFNATPGEEYHLIVDFAGRDPAVTNLDVTVAGCNQCFPVDPYANNGINFTFQAREDIETLRFIPATPVPVPFTLLLLGTGLILVAARGNGVKRLSHPL